MDFSDIRTIIIGEAGEYGKRLVRYLEIHLSSAVRVYHFTTAEGMVSFKEEAEIYLLDERFFKELSEEKQKFLKQKKLILLTWREEQGSFCKYDNPQKLLDMLSDFTDYNSDLSDLAAELKDTPTKLTIVYSPVYDEYLEQIARSFMSLGDVYMGAEDLGYKGIDSEYGEGGDMGDLCYYIHLREENILDILQDMLIPKEEVQVLHSPDLYFYLRELTKEDYAWFFDKIKKESPYREVFWGAGNCFVANVDMLSFFDQVILIDSRKNPRQSIFCDRLERVLNINQGEPQIWQRIYREDILDVPAVLLGGRLYMGNKGMMTVEASVVVPIILIIVVAEFFFGLFLIDMSVVKSETMRLADEAADVWKTDGKLADGTYKSQQLLLRNKNFLQKNRRGQLISKTRLRLQKRIATRLNIASLDSYKVSISGDKVLVQASVRLGNPLLGGRKYTGIKGWIFKCEEKADITNEEELLRKLSGNSR